MHLQMVTVDVGNVGDSQIMATNGVQIATAPDVVGMYRESKLHRLPVRQRRRLVALARVAEPPVGTGVTALVTPAGT